MSDPESSPVFKIPLIVLMLAGAYAIVGGIDRWAEREAAPLTTDRSPLTHHQVEYDLSACSPARVELSPIVYFRIRTQADAEPEIVGCTRYAVTPKPRRLARNHK